MLNDALPLAVAADEAVSAAKKAKRNLTPEEKALVDKVTVLADKIVQVMGIYNIQYTVYI